MVTRSTPAKHIEPVCSQKCQHRRANAADSCLSSAIAGLHAPRLASFNLPLPSPLALEAEAVRFVLSALQFSARCLRSSRSQWPRAEVLPAAAQLGKPTSYWRPRLWLSGKTTNLPRLSRLRTRRRHPTTLVAPFLFGTSAPCIAVDGNPVEAVHVEAAPFAI